MPRRLIGGMVASVLVLGLGTPLSAQMRGDTQTATSDVTFTTSGRSAWGEGPGLTLDPWEFEAFDFTWDEEFSDSDRSDWDATFAGQVIETFEFGGGVEMSTSGRLGLRFGMDRVDAGSIGATYPIRALVTLPAPNSFRDGEPVTIRTSWSLRDGGSIVSTAPDLRVYLEAPHRAEGSAGLEFCIFDCVDLPALSFDIPEDVLTIFEASPDGIIVQDETFVASSHTFTFAEGVVLGISGSVELPNGYPTGTSRSNNRLVATRTERWMDVNWDIDGFLMPIPGIGEGVSLPNGVSVGTNIVDFDLDLDHDHTRRFTLEGRPQVQVTFPIPMDWWVTNAAGTEVSMGRSTSATFDVGHDLNLIFPAGRKAPIDGGTEYRLPNDFESRGTMRFAGSLSDSILTAELRLPSSVVTETLQVGTRVDWTFSCDLGPIICEPARVLVGAAREVSEFWDSVVVAVVEAFTHTFGELDAEFGPHETGTVASWDETVDYFDEEWQLQGFTPQAGSPFSLDPEDPRISLTTTVSNTMAEGGGLADVIQELWVQNDGDVPLDLTSLTEELPASQLFVETLTSGDVVVDASFDGHGHQSVLTSGTVPVGGSAHLTMNAWAKPGLNQLQPHVVGQSPIGTEVRASAMAQFAWFGATIQPSEVVRGEGGLMLVTIKGSEALDVTGIDLASIRFDGLEPSEAWFDTGKTDGRPTIFLVYDQTTWIESVYARAEAGQTTQTGAVVVTPADTGVGVAAAAPNDVFTALYTTDRSISGDRLIAMDRGGNQNGRLDLGDLRATLFPAAVDHGVRPASFSADPGDASVATRQNLGEGVHRKGLAGLVSGFLNDGTPFWAQPNVTIYEER